MLLYHICSQWRTTYPSIMKALDALNYTMSLVFYGSRWREQSYWGRHSFDFEFLAWWHSNLGANSLHLRFDISHKKKSISDPKKSYRNKRNFWQISFRCGISSSTDTQTRPFVNQSRRTTLEYDLISRPSHSQCIGWSSSPSHFWPSLTHVVACWWKWKRAYRHTDHCPLVVK